MLSRVPEPSVRSSFTTKVSLFLLTALLKSHVSTEDKSFSTSALANYDPVTASFDTYPADTHMRPPDQ